MQISAQEFLEEKKAKVIQMVSKYREILTKAP
jgi:hypothetical protein